MVERVKDVSSTRKVSRPTMSLLEDTYREIKIKLLRSDFESFQEFSEEVFIAYLEGNLGMRNKDGNFVEIQ